MTKLFSPLRLTLFGVLLCVATFGILAMNPQKASADQCSVNGRDCWFGYFFNGYDGGPGVRRNNVLSAPALLNVHNAGALVATILGHLGGCPGGTVPNQGAQNPTGAAFIVLTMLGAPAGTPKNVACQRFSEWSAMVYNLEASGWIRFNQIQDFGGINTRSSGSDVTFYPMNGSANSIVFLNPQTGQPWYSIKKDCGNPIGQLHALTLAYDLSAEIGVNSGGAPLTGGTVEPGQPITFVYDVQNHGSTYSPSNVNCTARYIVHSGYRATPSPAEAGGTNVPTSCPRGFPPSQTHTVAVQTLATAANTTVCATLFITPSNQTGATASRELCVPVVSKPYLMVFGGDVSAGGELEGSLPTCSNASASIVSWNKNTAGYAGAGVQFAAQAMGTIKEFSTAQRSPAGGAGMPGGLSFSSTTQTGNKYGGDFGTAKCIKNHYADKPATTLTPSANNFSDLGTGDYFVNSSVAFAGGNINPGEKTTLYINGDLYISSNVTYAGSWSYGAMPMLKVVVLGNLYIGSGVTRLDGVYIAQQLPDLSKGYTYTCATDATPPFSSPTLTAGAFYSSCTNKLTVNGSVVSRSIQFLRTSGTLLNSTTTEDRTSNNAAENFIYGPASWMSQPAGNGPEDGEADNYDAITSLPPVL